MHQIFCDFVYGDTDILFFIVQPVNYTLVAFCPVLTVNSTYLLS